MLSSILPYGKESIRKLKVERIMKKFFQRIEIFSLKKGDTEGCINRVMKDYSVLNVELSNE